MTDGSDEPTTSELAAVAAQTRRRVAADVEELATQLTPQHLKDRALDAAERSVESLGARALLRLSRIPRSLAVLARQHPVATTAVGAAVVLLVWRARTTRI